jgi:hypothetical protein
LTAKGVGLPRSGIVGASDARRQRKAVGVAAIGRVNSAKAIELPRRDRALRHLIGRIITVGIGHAGDGKTVQRGALRVTDQAVELARVVGIDPRPVIGAGFAGNEQRSIADLFRAHAEEPPVTKAADG